MADISVLGRTLAELSPEDLAAALMQVKGSALDIANKAVSAAHEIRAKATEGKMFAEIAAAVYPIAGKYLGGRYPNIALSSKSDDKGVIVGYDAFYPIIKVPSRGKGARKSKDTPGNGNGKTTVSKVAAAAFGQGVDYTISSGGKSYDSPKEACKGLGLTCWENGKKGDGAGTVLLKYVADPKTAKGSVKIEAGGKSIPLEEAAERYIKAEGAAPATA